jgi:hypothetical protein
MNKQTQTNNQETKTNTQKKPPVSGTIEFQFYLTSGVTPPASSPGVGI